jgi:hypothetical protein
MFARLGFSVFVAKYASTLDSHPFRDSNRHVLATYCQIFSQAYRLRSTFSIYARGLEEAARHVEQQKAEYRKINREWHQSLGFIPVSLPARKRPLDDITNYASLRRKKTKSKEFDVPVYEHYSDLWEF